MLSKWSAVFGFICTLLILLDFCQCEDSSGKDEESNSSVVGTILNPIIRALDVFLGWMQKLQNMINNTRLSADDVVNYIFGIITDIMTAIASRVRSIPLNVLAMINKVIQAAGGLGIPGDSTLNLQDKTSMCMNNSKKDPLRSTIEKIQSCLTNQLDSKVGEMSSVIEDVVKVIKIFSNQLIKISGAGFGQIPEIVSQFILNEISNVIPIVLGIVNQVTGLGTLIPELMFCIVVEGLGVTLTGQVIGAFADSAKCMLF